MPHYRWNGLLLACLLAAQAALAGGAFEQSHSGFVNNAQCLSCHGEQAQAWQQSHHALAMQPARADTVLGDFDNRRFSGEGLQARFHREGEHFYITVDEAGERETYRVAWTFGVDPLQQYLLAFPDGRLQAFPVAWDVAGRRWFHLQAGSGIAHGDALHWRGRFYIANSFCIDCHTTGFRLGHDPVSGRYQSTAAGSNVGCQACHGPGSAHLHWAATGEGDNRGLPPRPVDPEAVMDTCAGCHSRRHPITPERTWAGPLLDRFMPSRLHAGLYHPDGQILDEVFEYGSFVQSRMHTAGVTCLDCHNPHSLQPRREGNGLCMDCHAGGQPRFAGMPVGAYDSPAHHRHAPGGPGSQCVDCHMPATTYMKIDPRRDHRFGIPRPDLSLSLGVPNACNGCHADRDAAWAQQAIAGWFPAGRHTRPDRATVIATARTGDRSALPGLQQLVGDPQEAAVWRATAIDLLADAGAALPVIEQALSDASPLLRAAAVSALENQGPALRLRYLPPRLHDPVRAVRIEAARLLADIPEDRLPDRRAWQQALAEYRLAQTALSDHPEGQTNLAQLAWRQGRPHEAIRQLNQALARDAHFIPAYRLLAVLYSQIGAGDRAVAVLQQARLKALPEQLVEIDYALALALAERKQLAEARAALQRVIAAQADHAAAHYNLGLLEQQTGNPGAAERHLQQALALNADDDRSRYALALLYLTMQQPARALPLLETLGRRYPQDTVVQQLLHQHRSP